LIGRLPAVHSHNYITGELAVFVLQSRVLPAAGVYHDSNLASAQYLSGKRPPEPIASLASRH